MSGKFPYGYCGMPCALCSRFRTDGKSKCPGCSCDGYYTEGCKTHHCCKVRGTTHCGNCAEFPCARLGKMADFRDLNTGNAKLRTCRAVTSDGFDRWYDAYSRCAILLTVALARYNNGRMKRYLCELFIQQDVTVLEEIMCRAQNLSGDLKQIGKDFQLIASAVIAETNSGNCAEEQT